MRKKIFRAGFVACLFLYGIMTQASGLQVAPVRLQLQPQQKVIAFRVRNLNKQAVILQTTIKQWHQENGEDYYQAQDDIFISPPIISIPAGATQIFRAAIRRPLSTTKEQSYRLFLQEVIGEAQKRKGGLHFAVRIGVPLFIAPKTIKQQKIKWLINKTAQTINVTAINNANTHVQISHIKLVDDKTKKIILDENVFHYLLAGQQYSWRFDKNKKAVKQLKRIKQAHLQVTSDIGPLSEGISIS